MGKYTTDPIETCEAWNDVLLIGVPSREMPAPAMPVIQQELIYGVVAWQGWFGGGIYNATRRIEWTGGGFEQTTYDPPYTAVLGGHFVQPSNRIDTEGFPKTGVMSDNIYLDPYTIDDINAAGMAAIIAHGPDWDTMTKINSSSAAASRKQEGIVYFSRYKWKIPSSHPGTYYKITWDLLFTPRVGDPEIQPGGEYIWTGPGDTGNANDASWFSPWIYLDPPDAEGSLEQKNLKFWNLSTSPYGIRPNTAWPA